MDLIGYTMSLESLINRQVCLVAFDVALMVLVVALSWLAPYIDIEIKKGKPKTKRKAEIQKKKKRIRLTIQIVLTVVSVVASAFVIKTDAETLSALKADAETDSISVYEGDAFMQQKGFYTRKNGVFIFSTFIVDYRLVTFDDSDEIYWIDMSKTDEGWVDDWGEFKGKIVYGENSKVILKIE